MGYGGKSARRRRGNVGEIGGRAEGAANVPSPLPTSKLEPPFSDSVGDVREVVHKPLRGGFYNAGPGVVT